MKSIVVLLFGASGTLAFSIIPRDVAVAPQGCTTSKICDKYISISDAQAVIPSKPNAAIKQSASRSNCGILGKCNTFDAAAQYVSTTGEHAFIISSPNDFRGPCPALNAAANHGYIPRSGIVSIKEAAQGLYDAYGLPKAFGAFLAAYAVIVTVDLNSLKWSIGDPPPSDEVPPDGNSNPTGISFTHDYFEGDTSLTRCDAYTNNGDAHALSLTRFQYAYESGMSNDRYTLDGFGRLMAKNTLRSIQTNPYYYAAFTSTTVFVPAFYNFAINFFSNHSAVEPAGYLDGSTLKSFFAVTGDYPNFQWLPGQERIPDNWYKRPSQNPYGVKNMFADLISTFKAYPDSFRFGNNSNGINTFAAFMIPPPFANSSTILQGDHLACDFLVSLDENALYPRGPPNSKYGPAELLNRYTPAYFHNITCPTYNNLPPGTSGFTPPYPTHGAAPVPGVKSC